jgi:hypothetical protein
MQKKIPSRGFGMGFVMVKNFPEALEGMQIPTR